MGDQNDESRRPTESSSYSHQASEDTGARRGHAMDCRERRGSVTSTAWRVNRDATSAVARRFFLELPARPRSSSTTFSGSRSDAWNPWGLGDWTRCVLVTGEQTSKEAAKSVLGGTGYRTSNPLMCGAVQRLPDGVETILAGDALALGAVTRAVRCAAAVGRPLGQREIHNPSTSHPRRVDHLAARRQPPPDETLSLNSITLRSAAASLAELPP